MTQIFNVPTVTDMQVTVYADEPQATIRWDTDGPRSNVTSFRVVAAIMERRTGPVRRAIVVDLEPNGANWVTLQDGDGNTIRDFEGVEGSIRTNAHHISVDFPTELIEWPDRQGFVLGWTESEQGRKPAFGPAQFFI